METDSDRVLNQSSGDEQLQATPHQGLSEELTGTDAQDAEDEHLLSHQE